MLDLAVFRLQDLCVHVQKSLIKHPRTASLQRAPQIEATFRWLRKRNIRIVLLSDFNIEQSLILLDRLGWARGKNELIETIVPEQNKTDNPIKRAMTLAGVTDPDRVLVVSDTPALLRSATAAQIRFNIGVTSGKCSYQKLQPVPCRALLDNTIQLVNYLLGEVPSLARLSPPSGSSDSTLL